MTEIRVTGLTKTFGTLTALDHVDFTFPESSVTCLLGPSGCGKTTLMRIIAGLEQPTAGAVYFGERAVTHLPPRKRDIGMVFQYPVVYRGITVRQNIALPLKAEKLSAGERARRVDDVITLLGLEATANADVSTLDNGTRQKVAVAREVARQPRIILFDEPITNVDAAAKLQLKRAFKQLSRALSQTIIYVTHDQTEAMTLADRIALMQDGRIVQFDTPRELYNHPADRFAGWFLGNPGMVFFDAPVHGSAGFQTLVSPLFPAPLALDAPGLTEGVGPISAGIRPEHILVSQHPAPGAVAATLLRSSIQIGGQHLLSLRTNDDPAVEFKAKLAPSAGAGLPGSGQVWVRLPPEYVSLFDATGKRVACTFFPEARATIPVSA